MAKHITKSVIEDIAYQLKNQGLWILESEKTTDPDLPDYTNAHVTLESLVQEISDVFVEHDPTFDSGKFNLQCQYRIDYL